MFEFTVLSAAFGMTFAFAALCHIYPGRFREPLDPRTTSHLFGMVFKITDKTTQEEKDRITQLLRDAGAIEVKEREMKQHY